MEKNYAVLTDSTSDLSPKLRERFGIDDYFRGVISIPGCPDAEGDLEEHEDSYFDDFYQKLKAKGFVIYPGKISQADTFRIGNIGDVHPDDFRRLVDTIREM